MNTEGAAATPPVTAALSRDAMLLNMPDRLTDAEKARRYRDRKRGAAPRQLQPCGTVAAARRHERNGEPKCEPCAAALREHNAEQYRRRMK